MAGVAAFGREMPREEFFAPYKNETKVRDRPVRVVAERGVKNVQAFGWSTATPEVIAMLKNPEAKFYLVLTDVEGNQVSVEIDPSGMELRADTTTGIKTADYVKIPVVALEVEIPGEPPVELLGPSTTTMRVESKPAPKPRRLLVVKTQDYYTPIAHLTTREYWRGGKKLHVDTLTDAEMRQGLGWPVRTFDDKGNLK